jgi:hypothetical protein
VGAVQFGHIISHLNRFQLSLGLDRSSRRIDFTFRHNIAIDVIEATVG